MNTSPALVAESKESMEMFRDAMSAGEMVPFYQPLWDLKHQRWEGVESLVRWNHPTAGLLIPDQFIPFAEKTGLIIELGESVLRSSCQQMRRWQHQGLPHGKVAVNISPVQIHEADFIDRVVCALLDADLPADSLELEITETLAMNDTHAFIQRLQQLRDMGVSISIDDFGTGCSSLTRLQCCPVTRLKVDGSFVHLMVTEQRNFNIVKSIIMLAHSLDLSVVAEGVETEKQQQLLKELGCDVLQGYWLGVPNTAKQVETLWRH